MVFPIPKATKKSHEDSPPGRRDASLRGLYIRI
jgi:hypothetical protein